MVNKRLKLAEFSMHCVQSVAFVYACMRLATPSKSRNENWYGKMSMEIYRVTSNLN